MQRFGRALHLHFGIELFLRDGLDSVRKVVEHYIVLDIVSLGFRVPALGWIVGQDAEFVIHEFGQGEKNVVVDVLHSIICVFHTRYEFGSVGTVCSTNLVSYLFIDACKDNGG